MTAVIVLLGVPPAPAQPAECGTVPGLEEQVLETARRRAFGRGERLLAVPVSESQTPLERLLGPDGDLESGGVVDVGDIAVIMDDGSGIFGTVVSGFSLDIVRLARQYYSFYPDDVDTLAFMPHFDHASGTYHLLIHNSVQGINRPTFDDTAIYGSAGRLGSLLVFSNYLRKPESPAARIPGDNNTALSLMAHEFAHRFSAFVRFDSDPGPGLTASNRLLGRGLAHWCFFHDTRAAFGFAPNGFPSMSSLEGNLWRQSAADGTWSTAGVTDGYSPLDLYLMGLMAPEEVPPFFVLSGPSSVESLPSAPGGGPSGESCVGAPRAVPPQVALTVEGVQRPITLDDVLAVEGPRIPDHTISQRQFRQTLALVARAGRFPTPTEIARLDRLRREWEPYFAAATAGRAQVDTTRPTRTGPAVTFAVVRLPDDIQAGRPTVFGLMALDAEGRVATGYTGRVALSSPTDPAAVMPSGIEFTAADAGYRLVGDPVIFATGGLHDLIVTDEADSGLTGHRLHIEVEDMMAVICAPEPGPEDLAVEKPWGVGATFSGINGVRFQYLIRADRIGRPAVIRALDWLVRGGPDGVQWESLVIRMANRPDFDLETRDGEVSLDRNLKEFGNNVTVLFGPREQRGMPASGRVHMVLDTPFLYNGIDNLLIDVRYTGGGPPGLLTNRLPTLGEVLTIERLGPNFPVQLSRTSTICLGVRLPEGAPPSISAVEIGNIRNDNATLSWVTSPATDGRVEYGRVGGPLDRSTAADRFNLSHSLIIGGLQPATTYQAVAVSRNYDAQETRSAPVTFTTTAVHPQVFVIDPPALPRGVSNTFVRVLGANFFPGLTATIVEPDLDGPDPPALDPSVRVVNISLLTEGVLDIGVTIDGNAPLGPRRLHVVNTDGFEVYSDVFIGVIPPREANDINTSGRVDGFDLAILARAFGASFGDPRYTVAADLDGDGDVDGLDLTRLANNFAREFTP